ncbi:hypothetical protein BDW68DRAFT_178032 [Aspergillus falconensis]
MHYTILQPGTVGLPVPEATYASAAPAVGVPYIRRSDGPSVGLKRASLASLATMLAPQGVAIPSGFAVTAPEYWEFVRCNGIREYIGRLLAGWQAARTTLADTWLAGRKRFL